jgi:hypothetical protein
MSEEKNWHERLLEESDELGKKVDKLSAFVEGDGIENVSNNQALINIIAFIHFSVYIETK